MVKGECGDSFLPLIHPRWSAGSEEMPMSPVASIRLPKTRIDNELHESSCLQNPWISMDDWVVSREENPR